MDDWMDDGTDDGSGGFRGCFTPPAQNASYIDVLIWICKKIWSLTVYTLNTTQNIYMGPCKWIWQIFIATVKKIIVHGYSISVSVKSLHTIYMAIGIYKHNTDKNLTNICNDWHWELKHHFFYHFLKIIIFSIYEKGLKINPSKFQIQAQGQ